MGEWRAGNVGPVAGVTGKVTVDLASAGSAAITLATIAIAGAEVGDIVLIGAPAAGVSVAVAFGVGYVASAGSARVPVINPTAGALDAASATYDYVLIKKVGADTTS